MIESVVILLLAVGGPLLIWWGSRLETNDSQITDRRTAERAARADTANQRETRTERDTDETRQ